MQVEGANVIDAKSMMMKGQWVETVRLESRQCRANPSLGWD